MLKLGNAVAIAEPLFTDIYIKGPSGWSLQKIDEKVRMINFMELLYFQKCLYVKWSRLKIIESSKKTLKSMKQNDR